MPLLSSSSSSSSSSTPSSDLGEPSNQLAAASTFPEFSALPPEIRLQVWRFFAPIDRRRGPQVLGFDLKPPMGRKQTVVRPCPSLVNQTAAVRAALAVSRETRAEALKAYPHALSLCNGAVVVRFDRNRDVVLVDTPEPGQVLANWHYGVWGFTEEVCQLAVGPRYFGQFRLDNMHPGYLLKLLDPFERLTVVYYGLTACVLDGAACGWCVSPKVNSFYRPLTVDTRRPYRPDVVYCWPDLASERGRQYARQARSLREGEFATSPSLDDFIYMIHEQVPPDEANAFIVFHRDAYSCITHEDLHRLRKVEYWPMVAFSGISCIRRYRALGGVDMGRFPDDSDTD